MKTFSDFLTEAKSSRKRVGSSLDKAKAFKAREKSRMMAQRSGMSSQSKPIEKVKKTSNKKKSVIGSYVKSQSKKTVKSVGKAIEKGIEKMSK